MLHDCYALPTISNFKKNAVFDVGRQQLKDSTLLKRRVFYQTQYDTVFILSINLLNTLHDLTFSASLKTVKVFWDITLCQLVIYYRRFGEAAGGDSMLH